MAERYQAEALIGWAAGLFQHAGAEAEKARAIGEILVEGDLLGHSTHGLALLPPNLDELEAGRMATSGRPEVIAQAGAVQTWNGRRLPGPWLVREAIGWAGDTARETGVAAVAIQQSMHIGCLAAYLRPVAEAGQMLILCCSDPSTASVAPFGGTRRVYTPNPLAAGWPSPGGPVMLDVSMSATTNGMTGRLRAEGRRFEHDWLLDADGRPTNDPEAFFTDPAGTLMPLGGVESGHKGYALGLLIEALTAALGGFGRASGETRWGAAILVLVLDPARFAGTEAFMREASWMAEAVHANPPIPGGEAPRLPGQRGLARRAEQLMNGVALHPSIPPAILARARRSGYLAPLPVS